MRCNGTAHVWRCQAATEGEHRIAIDVDIPDSVRVRDRAGLDCTARLIGFGGLAIGAIGAIAGLVALHDAAQNQQPQASPYRKSA